MTLTSGMSKLSERWGPELVLKSDSSVEAGADGWTVYEPPHRGEKYEKICRKHLL